MYAYMVLVPSNARETNRPLTLELQAVMKEISNMGAENQSQVLWKSSPHC